MLEASSLLSVNAASGRETNRGQYLEWRLWLNTAHGNQYSHSNMMLQEAEAKRRKAAPHPEDPLLQADEGVMIDPTNCHFLLYQQEPSFNEFWAQWMANNPNGLVQRFLFSFGTAGDSIPTRLVGFFDRVAVPIIRRLFELVLLTVGAGAEARVFGTTDEQIRTVADLAKTTKNYADKPLEDPEAIFRHMIYFVKKL